MPEEKKINYVVVDKKEEADAAAWVFTSKSSFKKEYIKLPSLKSDEIRARILYTSLCHSDSIIGRGEWGDMPYPICPGHEIIAKIIMKGEAVDNLDIGDIVGIGPFDRSCGECKFCKKGWNHACEKMSFKECAIFYHRFGGFATHIQEPGKLCVKIPKGIDISKAAPFLCAGITVFTPISLYVKPDDKVAILGCGGLGHCAVQFCKVFAKEVTVVTHSKEKIEDIKKLNPDKILLADDFYKDTPNLEYDVIIDTLPIWPEMDHVKKWVDSLNYYGKLIVLGVVPKNQSMNFDVSWLTLKSNLLISSLSGGKKQMEDMFDVVAKNKLECMCEYYEFDEFDKALKKLEKGHPHFRVVVNTEKAALEIENKK